MEVKYRQKKKKKKQVVTSAREIPPKKGRGEKGKANESNSKNGNRIRQTGGRVEKARACKLLGYSPKTDG